MNKENQPHWYEHAVIYQIYPLSFKDSNNDGFGDLVGIISKLPYLAWLGIDAVWLSPVYSSPMKDFGYDISDYENIDPRFGSLDIFKMLIQEAEKNNIKIMMDLVVNHTSSEHPWFVESRSSLTNPKRDWYVWRDPNKFGGLPNNWVALSGGPAWTLDQKTGQYYLHNFLPEQPDLNWRNPEVQKAVQDIMKFWMDLGVKGFRVDAINNIIEDKEFRDDPLIELNKDELNAYNRLSHIYSKDQPEIKDIVALFSETAAPYEDVFIVNEVYLPPEHLLEYYKASTFQNQAPFNFSLMSLGGSAEEYRYAVDTYEKTIDQKYTRVYVLGNHDRPRLSSRIGKENLRLMAVLFFTLPGVSFIYYGEEIGMENAEIPDAQKKDLFISSTSFLRDQARTPMQWDGSEFADFSKVMPWLPVADTKKIINVETETDNKHSLLYLYKELIELKHREQVLKNGTYESFDTSSKDVYAFKRSNENISVYVYLNFSDKEIHIDLPKGTFTYILSTHSDTSDALILKDSITLSAYEGVILHLGQA